MIFLKVRRLRKLDIRLLGRVFTWILNLVRLRIGVCWRE